MGIFGNKDDNMEESQGFSSPPFDSKQEDLSSGGAHQENLKSFKAKAYNSLMDRVDLVAANKMAPEHLRQEVEQFISDFYPNKIH